IADRRSDILNRIIEGVVPTPKIQQSLLDDCLINFLLPMQHEQASTNHIKTLCNDNLHQIAWLHNQINNEKSLSELISIMHNKLSLQKTNNVYVDQRDNVMPQNNSTS